MDAPCSGALSAAGVVVTRSVTATLASALAPAPFAFFPSFLATFAGFPRQALNRGLPLGFRFSALRHLDPKNLIRVMVHVVGHRPDRRFFAL